MLMTTAFKLTMGRVVTRVYSNQILCCINNSVSNSIIILSSYSSEKWWLEVSTVLKYKFLILLWSTGDLHQWTVGDCVWWLIYFHWCKG